MRHPLYNTWAKMKSRCYNTNNTRYSSYGGRGIVVCDEWINSFDTFILDMGEKPTPKHTLDRIDNNGNYSKDNCKWSTPSEQTYNQGIRKDNNTGHKNISYNKTHKRYYVHMIVNGKSKVLGSSKDINDAIQIKHSYIKTVGTPKQ